MIYIWSIPSNTSQIDIFFLGKLNHAPTFFAWTWLMILQALLFLEIIIRTKELLFVLSVNGVWLLDPFFILSFGIFFFFDKFISFGIFKHSPMHVVQRQNKNKGTTLQAFFLFFPTKDPSQLERTSLIKESNHNCTPKRAQISWQNMTALEQWRRMWSTASLLLYIDSICLASSNPSFWANPMLILLPT